MALTKDDDVLEPLPSDGSHETFCMWILPRRPRCGEDLLDAEALDATAELVAENAVAIADHEPRRRILGEGLDDLLGGPGRGRGVGDVEVKNAAALVGQDEEDIQNANVAVGTVKKSIDASEPTWLSRKVRQVWEGRCRHLGGMKRDTVRSPMSMPSFSKSQ